MKVQVIMLTIMEPKITFIAINCKLMTYDKEKLGYIILISLSSSWFSVPISENKVNLNNNFIVFF